MASDVVLSICIPLHNRSQVVMEHIKKVLEIDSSLFDIIISDTSDQGKDFISIYGNLDRRVKVFRADSTTPFMKNWYYALEHADGTYAIHVNDRDEIIAQNIPAFIEFLRNNKILAGGVCKYMKSVADALVYEKGHEALIKIPYFAWHTTGIFVNTAIYRSISDREKYFSLDFNIHAHDAILGVLSTLGCLAIYTGNVWNYASKDFYKKNPSVSTSVVERENYFFMPEVRISELKDFLVELDRLPVDNHTKYEKRNQMYETYLRLATANYFYYMESDHEMQHYGMQAKKYSLIYKLRFSYKIADDLCNDLNVCMHDRKRIVQKTMNYNLFCALGKKMPSGIKMRLLSMRDELMHVS